LPATTQQELKWHNRVGMHMDPGRGNGIRLASHHPAGAKV